MEYSSKHLEDLIERLAKLPSIGKKTALRLAFHLLKVPAEEALELARAIERVRTDVVSCEMCGNIAETQPCYLCADPSRDHAFLCVVEQPGDVIAIERSGVFHGLYHVLRGSLSPLDGIGPDDLRIRDLVTRVDEGGYREIIVATNPTAQGEATAHYLNDLLRDKVRLTRIARGLPIGADLELSDQITLARAIEGRKEI
ncbi:MAG: recombination protein RecR [Candidatus Eisenbacteria bacterium]|nr:recombination protein RecR [Candidatus Eisenbacteria bacterium]MCC7142560.1 recombination protein RecR [Candidatus Eisenbacteria bacterium]